MRSVDIVEYLLLTSELMLGGEKITSTKAELGVRSHQHWPTLPISRQLQLSPQCDHWRSLARQGAAVAVVLSTGGEIFVTS